MQDNQSPLLVNHFYHVYNRPIGSERLFFTLENDLYFLRTYQKYILSIAESYGYCLMPNRFHFLVKIKSLEEILDAGKNLSGLQPEPASGKFSQQFSNLFNVYSKALNKQFDRKGSLFTRPFKKKEIETETYLKNTVIYIHQNPVEAGLVKNIADWPFSADEKVMKNENDFLDKSEVVNWFGHLENFVFCRKNNLRI